jgi:thiaminase (transcriptional activator TenA)
MATKSMKLAKDVSELWTMAVSHPIGRKMGDGTLPKDKFYIYLAQDKFLCEAMRGFVCEVLADCPDAGQFEAVHGMIANLHGYGKEDTMFDQLFRELGVSAPEMGPYPVTDAFSQFVWKVGATGKVVDRLIVLYVIHALYMEWADKALPEMKGDAHPVYSKWMEIHSSRNVGELVGWIESTIDFHLEDTDVLPEHIQLMKRTVEYEIMFFDAAYRDNATDFPFNDFQQNRSLDVLMR